MNFDLRTIQWKYIKYVLNLCECIFILVIKAGRPLEDSILHFKKRGRMENPPLFKSDI